MGDLSAVIAGLDPAIHHIETTLVFLMDARVKPAHDESKSETVGINAIAARKTWMAGTSGRSRPSSTGYARP